VGWFTYQLSFGSAVSPSAHKVTLFLAVQVIPKVESGRVIFTPDYLPIDRSTSGKVWLQRVRRNSFRETKRYIHVGRHTLDDLWDCHSRSVDEEKRSTRAAS
jgi:hypothetical protein